MYTIKCITYITRTITQMPIYKSSASATESAQLNLSNPPDISRLFEIARRLEGADIILYYVHNIMTRIIITLALKYSVAAPIRRTTAGSLSSSMSRLCRPHDAVARVGGMRSYITHRRRHPSRFQLIKLGGANCRLPVHLYTYVYVLYQLYYVCYLPCCSGILFLGDRVRQTATFKRKTAARTMHMQHNVQQPSYTIINRIPT